MATTIDSTNQDETQQRHDWREDSNILLLARQLAVLWQQQNELDSINLKGGPAALARVGAASEECVRRWQNETVDAIEACEALILHLRAVELEEAAVQLMLATSRLDLIESRGAPEPEKWMVRRVLTRAAEIITENVVGGLDLYGTYGCGAYRLPSPPFYDGQINDLAAAE